MEQKISDFFKLPELKKKKEISTDQLLGLLAQHKIATNQGDAYYFLRICRGLNILKHIKSKTYEINHEEIQKREADKVGKE